MWSGWLVRSLLVSAVLVSCAHGAPDPRAFALDERGVPLTPPAFPASFRAEVEQRVTRAEGKTNVRPTLDDDADVGEFPDEATEPVLATVYHERRMQAERVDVHAPAPVSFLFLFSRGVAYQLTDEACHTAPIHHAMTNARLAQAATFLGKVNITRVAAFDDDVPDARSDSGSDSDADWTRTPLVRRTVHPRPPRVLRHRLRGTLVQRGPGLRRVRGGVRGARPGRRTIQQTRSRRVPSRRSRRPSIGVVTEYLEWTPRRSDPALFRPPPASAGCVPSPSGTLALAVERRNTLHFNPARPQTRPGRDFFGGEKRRAGAGAGARAGAGPGGCGYTVDADSSESGSGLGPDSSRRGARTSRTRGTRRRTRRRVRASPGGARFIHPDEAAAARAAAAARGDRDPYETPRKIPDSNRFDTAFRHPRDRGRVRPGVVAGFVEDKDDGSGPTLGDGRRGRRGGWGAGSCERGNAARRNRTTTRCGREGAGSIETTREEAVRRALLVARAGVLRIHRSRGVYVVEFAVFQRRVDVHPSRGFHRNHITTSPRASHASSTLKVRYRLRKSQTRTRRRG